MKCSSFREAEDKMGIEIERNDSALDLWYNSVREKPFSAFSVDDMCKAVRQKLYTLDLMPHVVKMLRNDPQAGEQYDGELLVALRSISIETWNQLAHDKVEIRSIIEKNWNAMDEDIRDDCKFLLKNLG